MLEEGRRRRGTTRCCSEDAGVLLAARNSPTGLTVANAVPDAPVLLLDFPFRMNPILNQP